MALFDNLAKTLADAASKAAEATKNIDAKEIQKNLTNAVNDTVTKVKDTADAIDPKDIPGSLSKMASDAGQAIVKHNNDRKESQASAKEVLHSAQAKQNYLTVHDAMKVIYLLMFSDRDFTEDEKAVFLSAGSEIDPSFSSDKDALIAECTAVIQAAENGNYEQNIHDTVAKTIWNSSKEKDAAVSGRLLIWNMIAAAYADGNCAADEHDLIRFAGNELKVETEIIQEMESAMKTMIAVSKEEQWLKESGRTYNEVRTQVDELENRRNIIMQGIQALLKD
ncbi:MAG: hypothetical protein LKM41_06850 [Lachnospiraceae bacterium]|jgi:hypothetical protein|nr:hypothetical protein [Lachnospiraceae bacterium]